MKHVLPDVSVQLDPAVTQRLLDLITSAQGAARALGSKGWTAPGWATLRDTVEILERSKTANLDQLMVRLYRARKGVLFHYLEADLIRLARLRRWRPILRECIKSYHRRAYRVTIPALLTVLEGCVADLSRRYQTSTNVKNMVRDQVERVKRRSPNSLTLALWESTYAFVAELYRNVKFSGKRPPFVNRHWILHGRDTTRWGVADSLRLFQAVHTMGSLSDRFRRRNVAAI